jgi:hypothetical protein
MVLSIPFIDGQTHSAETGFYLASYCKNLEPILKKKPPALIPNGAIFIALPG